MIGDDSCNQMEIRLKILTVMFTSHKDNYGQEFEEGNKSRKCCKVMLILDILLTVDKNLDRQELERTGSTETD